ncbi:ParB N-terminal domain-containing protein [Desulfotignum balticum]|uniref:ParB N-terminal domain-containing protein n=1 Tax=Desulfotignum balticum TaxID=115781 RepID=UPI001FE0B404|nr:ParB N-terminal domain-containing protein [Desulfotignum balticum]
MPLFNISDLIWDEIIYPRSARKQQTIDAYSEALAAGAQFPPIIIQPVVNYPAPNTPLSEILLLILDGIHRWSAYKVLGLTEIEAVLWQDQPLDYATCKDDMLLESARRNINHRGPAQSDGQAAGGQRHCFPRSKLSVVRGNACRQSRGHPADRQQLDQRHPCQAESQQGQYDSPSEPPGMVPAENSSSDGYQPGPCLRNYQ